MGIIRKTTYIRKKRKPIYVVALEREDEPRISWFGGIHVFSTLKKAEKFMQKTYDKFEHNWLLEHDDLPEDYLLFGDMFDEFYRRISLRCYEYELNCGLLDDESSYWRCNPDKFANKRLKYFEQLKSEREQ